MTDVLNSVLDGELRLSLLDGDTSDKTQLVAEHARFRNLPFHPVDVFIALPGGAAIHQAGRRVRDSAMQAKILATIGIGNSDLCEAAGSHQSTVKASQPTNPLLFEECWADYTGGRDPGKGQATLALRGYVKACMGRLR